MKKLFFDMDGVLADFESGLAKVEDSVKKEYEGHYDQIPGLFSLMSPFIILSSLYNVRFSLWSVTLP